MSSGPAGGPAGEEAGQGAGDRAFEHGGRRWIARVAGRGALGTGSLGLGLVEAVHFCDAAEPARPLREALIARGRFADLYDEELALLLDRAVAITAGAGGEPSVRRPRRPHAD